MEGCQHRLHSLHRKVLLPALAALLKLALNLFCPMILLTAPHTVNYRNAVQSEILML